jgi:microcystin-dependent protein
MSEQYLAEIKIVTQGGGPSLPPKGWALCNGQLLPINQNQALFSLLGTTYGGDGRVNFGLPNLQGRVPIHMGNGFALGEPGGETTHTLTISETPAHTHVPVAMPTTADQTNPTGNVWGGGRSAYSPTPGVAMTPANVLVSGGSQPHENMSPYLVLNFIIALQGIFPSQN